jgi:hypothetical protein
VIEEIMQIQLPSHLSDAEIVAGVARFASSERESTAQLVAHLAEMDARRLYLGAGYQSLFAYCCEVVHLSEDATFNRIEAARAARRFPAILDRLSDGTLSVTTVRLLNKHLTPDNYQELLAAAAGRSKREVEELVARHAPKPDVPDSIRKVPVGRSVSTPSAISTGVVPSVPSLVTAEIEMTPPPVNPPPAPRRTLVAPLAPDRYEVKFTVSAETRDKLRLAQELLRHANPSGDLADVVDRALTLLLADLARKKFGETENPRESPGVAEGSRRVAARVRRTVWRRDGGRCAFVARDGHRCTARSFLEYHHVKPYAAGGEATVENIQLRCRAHNQYESDLFFEGIVRESGIPYELSPRCSTRSGTGGPWPVSPRTLLPVPGL